MASSSSILLLFSFLLSASAYASQWEAFLNLTDCRLGDANPALPGLKKYLRRFGYMPPAASHASNLADSFDSALHAAVRTYQRNFNLNATGILDTSTVRQLMTPRCGVPDFVNGTTSMASGKLPGRLLYAYFSGEPKWPPSKRQLTYAITSPGSFDPSILGPLFARAFGRWAEVTGMSFSESSSGDSDITIGFYSGDHGDGVPFDGPLSVLAHSFAPTIGMFHLDAEEEWVAEGDVRESPSQYAIDMESVAVHEIGHLLGMGHTSVSDAIMYPSIAPRTRKVELQADDIDGIRNLYGMQK